MKKNIRKGKKLPVWLAASCTVALAVGLSACAPAHNEQQQSADLGVEKLVATVEKAAMTPETDEFGVVDAAQWKDAYPNEYASYLKNLENDETGKADYLELYPEIKTLGKGYGYAKYYTEPLGHLYSLETIGNNGRINEKTTASCITCKTPQFTSEVQQNGDEMFSANFKDTLAKYDEPISCYNCHENDPTQLVVTQQNWQVAMGDDADKAPLSAQVCGQCHNDYYFDPETKVTMNPYDGLDSMTPEQSLAWYDSIGFSDWTYESTGAKLIAVRHPEFEYNFGGDQSPMVKQGYSCNDCHMAKTTAEDGTVYSDHNWISPLENEELIERDCSKCHADIKSEIASIQEDLKGQIHQLGLREERFIHNFEDAIAAGTITDDEKARLQVIQRDAEFYWNFVNAENSKGAHNPDLTTDTIGKATVLVDEADEILGVSSLA